MSLFFSYLNQDRPDFDITKANKLVDNFKLRFEYPYCIIKTLIGVGTEKYSNGKTPSKFKGWLSFIEYSEIINDIINPLWAEPNTNEKRNASWEKFIKEEKSKLKNSSFSTYIPILRSLKKVSGNKNLYKKRIYEDYFSDFTEIKDTNIFTGEDLYSEIYDIRDGIDEKAQEQINDFIRFIEKHFIKEGFRILTPGNLGKDKDGKSLNNKKDLFLSIGHERRLISCFGDGIQSLIILIFPLFRHQNKKHLLFIDEPELNLHPGMQRLFLKTLNLPEFKNTQVFISTHSNHLLNTITEFQDEISVFSFKKLKENTFKINNISKRASEALDLLGVNNSSVFLANCTIWVEGISDRLHIQKYLELYYYTKLKKTKFKEDYHFAFVG